MRSGKIPELSCTDHHPLTPQSAIHASLLWKPDLERIWVSHRRWSSGQYEGRVSRPGDISARQMQSHTTPVSAILPGDGSSTVSLHTSRCEHKAKR
jgi:hypothetical protein